MPLESVFAIAGFVIIGLAFGAQFVSIKLANQMTWSKKLAFLGVGLFCWAVAYWLYVGNRVPQAGPVANDQPAVAGVESANQSVGINLQEAPRAGTGEIGGHRVEDADGRSPPTSRQGRNDRPEGQAPINVTATNGSVAAGRDIINSTVRTDGSPKGED